MIANSMIEQELSRSEKRDGENVASEDSRLRQLTDGATSSPLQPLLESAASKNIERLHGERRSDVDAISLR